jgi:hypothetical protein
MPVKSWMRAFRNAFLLGGVVGGLIAGFTGCVGPRSVPGEPDPALARKGDVPTEQPAASDPSAAQPAYLAAFSGHFENGGAEDGQFTQLYLLDSASTFRGTLRVGDHTTDVYGAYALQAECRISEALAATSCRHFLTLRQRTDNNALAQLQTYAIDELVMTPGLVYQMTLRPALAVDELESASQTLVRAAEGGVDPAMVAADRAERE